MAYCGVWRDRFTAFIPEKEYLLVEKQQEAAGSGRKQGEAERVVGCGKSGGDGTPAWQ